MTFGARGFVLERWDWVGGSAGCGYRGTIRIWWRCYATWIIADSVHCFMLDSHNAEACGHILEMDSTETDWVHRQFDSDEASVYRTFPWYSRRRRCTRMSYSCSLRSTSAVGSSGVDAGERRGAIFLAIEVRRSFCCFPVCMDESSRMSGSNFWSKCNCTKTRYAGFDSCWHAWMFAEPVRRHTAPSIVMTVRLEVMHFLSVTISEDKQLTRSRRERPRPHHSITSMTCKQRY